MAIPKTDLPALDSTPARVSTNFTVSKQTQTSSFGEKLQAGMTEGARIAAAGASLMGGALPGPAGAIVSTAISSFSTLAGLSQGSPASSASYAAAGAVGLGAPASGPVTTTVGTTSGGGVNVGGINVTSGATTSNLGTYNSQISNDTQGLHQMLQVQAQLQKENQMFTSISNVLKTKHDTVKNSISNIR